MQQLVRVIVVVLGRLLRMPLIEIRQQHSFVVAVEKEQIGVVHLTFVGLGGVYHPMQQDSESHRHLNFAGLIHPAFSRR